MTLNAASPEFLNALAEHLPDGVLAPPEPRFLEEPRGMWTGLAGVVARPSNTAQISTIITAAHAARVPVVPYSGGTGLVGGQVRPDGPAPIVLSLERMNRVRAVYPSENVIVVEAGVILDDVQQAADDVDRLFPLAIAASGTARIGGNLATNAGGVNVLRYGNTRDLCLGLEAVLPDGQIWNGLTRLRKDNTGYDLRDLLIGSEGTLGVITAAALKLFAKPRDIGTALLVVPAPRAALDLLALARDQVGEAISSFELIHRQGLEFLADTRPQVRLPFSDMPEWTVLIELGVSGGINAQSALEALFGAALDRDLVSDGIVAQSDGQRSDLWAVRESIPEANRLIGSISSHDISLPLSELPAFITDATARITEYGPLRINCFGHLGDGNLHFNVFPPKGQDRAEFADLRPVVKKLIHDAVHERGGSFSAEHGVGRLKVDDLERYGDPTKLAAMRVIKAALDPAGIMNPGAVLKQG